MKMQEFKEICANPIRDFNLNGCEVVVYPDGGSCVSLQPIDYNDEDNVMDGVMVENLTWKELRRAYNALEEIIATQKK